MAGLLDQQIIDTLLGVVQQRVDSNVDILRGVMFSGVPAGFERLDTPEKRAVVERTVTRKADQEQRGTLPGNLNSTMLAHPAMRDLTQEGVNEQL